MTGETWTVTVADGRGGLIFGTGDPAVPGSKTPALPIIWTEKDKFNAIFAKMNADATAAGEAVVDEATLKAQTPKVLGNCKACHDVYRAKT